MDADAIRAPTKVLRSAGRVRNQGTRNHMHSTVNAVSDDTLRAILKSQYHAALAMLLESIERCPEELWYSRDPQNAFWQVAYHTLFFAQVYLGPNAEAFSPWAHHQGDVQHPDGIAGRIDEASALPVLPEPYSRADVLAYWQVCDSMVDAAVDALDLRSPDSGFRWYRISKLEHQFVSIRHIQHHAAQLADRLRAAAHVGITWVGAVPR
jgi:lambda repressor-like predicted transcriptional regulator